MRYQRSWGCKMKKDFEEIREQVEILDLARYLMKQGKKPTLFYYPNEKTASVKIYEKTRSFYDFGRATGGDCVKLYSHIKKCDQWVALQEIRMLYKIEKPDKERVREKIRQQEAERRTIEYQKQEKQRYWRQEVDFLKKLLEAYEKEIAKADPFSDTWCHCMNKKQLTEYELDCICRIIEN